MLDEVYQIALGLDEVIVRVSAASDVGAVRTVNEDSFLAAPPVFLVADGMGGHAHGDLASREIARVFQSLLAGTSSTSTDVLSTIAAANLSVRNLTAPGASDLAIAGSTLTGVAIVEGADGARFNWMAFNVGDSRIYTWHSNHLTQLTVDHSAVQELIDLGQITEGDAAHHPERNVVTRALGVDADVEPDIWLIPTGGRQVFLICSDGLTKELPDSRISEIIADHELDGERRSLAGRLVEAAIAAGGKDNVTVVVVDTEWRPRVSEGPETPEAWLPAFLEETMPRG